MADVSAYHLRTLRRIRLVIADPQPIVQNGLRSVFAAQHDFEIVASCSHGTSCLEAIRNLAPDVALLGTTLPDLTGSEILAIAKAENLPTRLVFFAEPERGDDLTAAIEAGACSAISKYANPDTILRSLRLMTGRISAPPERSQELSPNGKEVDCAKIERMLAILTDREREIMRLVSEGLSNKEIARELNLSQGTVKVHLYNMFQKLEISNRTVLATIALLEKSAGSGTLLLAALAFAISSDAKASNTNDTSLDDDSTAYRDLEHSGFELWKREILRHIAVADAGETAVLAGKDFSVRPIQVTHPAARMEELRAAEQAVPPSLQRGYGPIGSSTPHLSIPPLLQPINNSQLGSATAQQPFPPPEFASNPIRSHGGYGTFAVTTAGLIYALDDSHAAAQARDPGETPIDTATVAITDGTPQVATITIHDGDNLASIVHDSHSQLALATLGHDGVTREGNAGQIIHGVAGADDGTGLVDVACGGSGNDTVKGTVGDDTICGGSGSDTINSHNGNDTIIGGYGGDRLTGGSSDDVLVYLSATESNSTQFDTIDFTSGEDQINLAAFGALAFLHMTSAGTSVPPHTLAWIYNPANNETIIYVNPTDRSLDVGDPGLLEIHLQGAMSVAESDFVYEPDAAAVAAALGGIDPALMAAITGDGTVLTTGSADAGESTSGTAGIWTMPADDGFRFHFGRDRIGSMVSSRLTDFGGDSAYATEASDDGSAGVPAHVSSIELAHSQSSVSIEENPTFGQEPGQVNAGAVTTGHGTAHATTGLELFEFGMQGAAIVAPVAVAQPVEPGVITGNSGGDGNSQHGSQSASAEPSASAGPAEPDMDPSNGVGLGNAQHPSHSASPSIMAAAEPIEPGVAPGNSAGHGNSQHGSQSASAKSSAAAEPAEPDIKPGNGVGHGNAQHPSHSAASSDIGPAESIEPGVAPGNSAGHGNSQRGSQSASAQSSAAAEPAESDIKPGNGVGHGNAQHPSRSASPSVMGAAEPMEPGVAPGNSAGHGNSQRGSQSASAESAAEPAEADIKPGNGVGHGNAQHASNPAAANASAAAELTGPDVAAVHGNSEHPSHSASPGVMGAAEPIEPGVAPGNSAGHGNSQHGSQSASAESAAAEPTEPGINPGDDVGHDNAQHASNPAAANASAAAELTAPGVAAVHGNPEHPSDSASPGVMGAAEPIEPGVAPGNSAGPGNSQHSSQSASATSSSAAEPTEPGINPGDDVGHDNAKLASNPAAANASAAAQPPEPASATGDEGFAFAFDFKNQGAPSTPTTTVELEDLNSSPHLPGRGAELAAILEVDTAAVHGRAASQVDTGQHHAMGYLPYELLT